MATRLGFIAGIMATSVLPTPSWADVGSPKFFSAAKMPNGEYRMFGLGRDGMVAFSARLPDRGHAAAVHPTRPEAIAFARRPGTYAIGIQCDTGKEFVRLDVPFVRHFYGHGVFATDGVKLLTTMNDYESGVGKIAVWDADANYMIVDEISSGGIGPHDISILPDQAGFVVANGGIQTHTETGRAKLNLADMQPCLSYFDRMDAEVERVVLDASLRRNSIRHLAIRSDGLVAFAMQWQGDQSLPVPLLGLHRRGKPVRMLAAPDDLQREMRGYGASVAFSGDGSRVAISSSRGGVVHIFLVESGGYLNRFHAPDVSGLAPSLNGFLATTGTGTLYLLGEGTALIQSQETLAWDNHLVAL